jgi:hypothetical protein
VTTPITIDLTPEQIKAYRTGSATVAYEILDLVRAALPEPTRPFQPGDPVDVLGGSWCHYGQVYVGPLPNGEVVVYESSGGAVARSAHCVRHHQEDTP